MKITNRRDLEKFTGEARAQLEAEFNAYAGSSTSDSKPRDTGGYQVVNNDLALLRQRILAAKKALEEGDIEAAKRILTIE